MDSMTASWPRAASSPRPGAPVVMHAEGRQAPEILCGTEPTSNPCKLRELRIDDQGIELFELRRALRISISFIAVSGPQRRHRKPQPARHLEAQRLPSRRIGGDVRGRHRDADSLERNLIR
jgi:hypothetical protein